MAPGGLGQVPGLADCNSSDAIERSSSQARSPRKE